MTSTSSERDLEVARYVGERVHTLIWSRRMTQGDVAAHVGVSGSTFSKKLRGLVPMTVDELMRVARLLDVEPGDLLPPVEREEVLPRLDSNQQPSGYLSALVRRLVARVFGPPRCSSCGRQHVRGTACVVLVDGVVDLAAYRARVAS